MTTSNVITDKRHIPADLHDIMEALARVSVALNRTIRRGALGGSLGAAVGENTDGDQQKALDVMADDAFAAALRGTGVKYYASEEQDAVVGMDPDGRFALAIDPLDGSSNIDVNVSIGTIFSIFDVAEDAEASFLRPARDQIAGGYIIFGPQTDLVVTFGDGVQMHVLDPDTQSFVLVNDALRVPEVSREFAINASNYRHWSPAIRAYIDDCLAGDEGPRDANYNMRWVASLVAETHRIMTRGGIFLYPGDARDGYERGRLRMIYECAPIAFLIEQAGGRATDGHDRILDGQADQLHARTPFVFGSAEKVSRVAAYQDLPDDEVSALFGNRGLFRA
ncbi:class 1 fructose-bisphosphatase [Aliiroseovarius subalbicans]|uniref:class 1 fructose-bisphosphatase n=1 Tax=Aliiroseovarius subalbicans TaxID=2925840 RepID=UPI001F56065A|nr:class 1 fructose-bisphosphatase [Aliiroseovarius subalbicans]MCI2399891.1 class 1 fructose-bisphosphatase [Aliiroseovarius subalbicans]